MVEEMHAAMCAALPIDRVEVCYDPHDDSASDRRKPKPGMLLGAASELQIDLSQSFMIGDRWRDIDCGQAAGCTTVFIDHGYKEQIRVQPDLRVTNLLDAARMIVAGVNTTRGKNEVTCQTA
jgi:D-glycero-D-manno-heptose 1,7-bisphosphate phosphatase